MSPKQKRFCEEYLANSNATQAAIVAGYSPKTARSQGQRMLTNVDIKNYIDGRMKSRDDNLVASADEILQYLTNVVRGESKSEVVLVAGEDVRSVKKTPDERERLKAAELLGKRHALFTDKQEVKIELPIFKGGEELED
ncbi:MAG: terminase small subunit [Bacillota bacterium]